MLSKKLFLSGIVLFVLVSFPLINSVEASSEQWSHTYGGSDNDSSGAMVQTSDGGYALAGYTSSFSADNSDVCWLIKVDSSGNLIWNRTYEGEHIISPIAGSIALVQTSEGGYAILCYSQVTFENKTYSNFLLIKADSAGQMEWSKMEWKIGQNLAYSLVQTSDKGYTLAGTTGSFGEGKSDAWLIKTDENGVIPEFPSLVIIPLFLTATLMVILYRKRMRNSC